MKVKPNFTLVVVHAVFYKGQAIRDTSLIFRKIKGHTLFLIDKLWDTNVSSGKKILINKCQRDKQLHIYH